jgi:hypothetical protein
MVLGCLALFLEGTLPCAGQRTPQALPCDYILLPQSDPGGCVSTGNPICDESVGGAPCCRHFHSQLIWNQAVRWVKPTGLMKGPSVKKYYTAVDSTCNDRLCSPGGSATDYLHYVWEDTVVGCPQ